MKPEPNSTWQLFLERKVTGDQSQTLPIRFWAHNEDGACFCKPKTGVDLEEEYYREKDEEERLKRNKKFPQKKSKRKIVSSSLSSPSSTDSSAVDSQSPDGVISEAASPPKRPMAEHQYFVVQDINSPSNVHEAITMYNDSDIFSLVGPVQNFDNPDPSLLTSSVAAPNFSQSPQGKDSDLFNTT